MELKGKTVGFVGALACFPRRLAAREVARLGGTLRRGTGRDTDIVVFGRRLVESDDLQSLERRLESARKSTGMALCSENGLLRMLGLLDQPEPGMLSLPALCEQSGLSVPEVESFSIFDALGRDRQPYGFRDLILARKYKGLLQSGTNWLAIVRSIHRAGDVSGLPALTIKADREQQIYAEFENGRGDLSGQLLLDVERVDSDSADAFFAAAEQAETSGELEQAATLYAKCLSLDPGDSVANFNRANCLRSLGKDREATAQYLKALKLDPELMEAWFNFADVQRKNGNSRGARQSLLQAIALDAEYADAIYNLAALEFDLGNLQQARGYWTRYLALDSGSAWARNAERGIRFIDRMCNRRRA